MIEIHDASLHNLKNVSVSIPKNRLVVVTGVSGSGKSTLMFDVLYEAGRRAYLEAIGAMSAIDHNPGVQRIDGLQPAVAVRQGTIRQSNPRSVVGTRTKLLHYIGLLFATVHNFRQPDAVPMTVSHFSFNSPLGMCLQCDGRGIEQTLDFAVLLPKKTTTLPELYQNACCETACRYMMKKVPQKFAVDINKPFRSLPEEAQNFVLYGINPTGKPLTGLDTQLRSRIHFGKNINGALKTTVCGCCNGYRISEEAMQVKVHRKHIGQLATMPAGELHEFFSRYQTSHKKSSKNPAEVSFLKQILKLLSQLIDVRLDYVNLYRSLPSLSGGEARRLFLMSCLSSEMDSLIYVFDEPTAGLHETEKKQLIDNFKSLTNKGNCVIVLEHDRQTIGAAEHIIDIGPYAGTQGGEVLFQGSRTALKRCSRSVTGQYLSGKKQVPWRELQAVNKKTKMLRLTGATTNNLNNVTVEIPLARLTGVAGVSGSGKSSLIGSTLVPALRAHMGITDSEAQQSVTDQPDLVNPLVAYSGLSGADELTRLVEVSQDPPGRRGNSNPATYLGLWNRIRQLFAKQPDAIKYKYSAGHFSFNAAGACSHCSGNGRKMMWLGTTYVTYQCDVCKGQRYKKSILRAKYNGLTISEVLEMSAIEALEFFDNDKVIQRILKVLTDTGMGYIKLGQPTSTLSGGEAQRLKLTREIGKGSRGGHTLYVLDEPTTGLSPHDIAQLMQLIDSLLQQGNSVIVIEHDPSVLSRCDWLIEIGPEGGTKGGRIICKGTPTQIAANKKSLLAPSIEYPRS